MHPDKSRAAGIRLLFATCASLGAIGPALAEEPLSVTYGPAALTAEGDQDYHEIIYLSVPDTTTERLFLRVFDADTGGAFDTQYGSGWNSEVRYALFGGEGAASRPAVPSTAKATRKPAVDVAGPAITGGEQLAEATLGENAGFDDAWQTLASVLPAQGDHVDGRYVFRLEVTGLSGNDGNLFAATLSTRDRRDARPDGLEITDYVPTVRIPDKTRATEVSFAVPADAQRLSVHNFDAAGGEVVFTSTYRSVPLAASGQDEWRASSVELLPEERGTVAAIVASGGQEIPNDLSLFVTDDADRLLPMRLPPVAAPANGRPMPVADHTPLADCLGQAFDASRSTDPDGDRLRYRWEFGDGSGADGVAAVHRYAAPGTYQGVLQVRDSSSQVGNGALLPFQITVKRPPAAAAGPDMLVAPGEAVTFDGSASAAGDRPIARYGWDFQDGTTATGVRAVHAFERSGHYVVTLRVQDDRPGSCDSSADQLVVDVNAPPVAVAGPPRHAATGETVTLDGGQSYDVDGEVVGWEWDLGDGTKASGKTVVHAYPAPGRYTVTLTVRDGAGLPNSVASGTALIVVNDPPVAVAGPDRQAAVGELLAFDGSGSTDRDGKLVHYDWDFGDGSLGAGVTVQYAYDRPGTYPVTLTVTDDSGSSSSTATDQAVVRVNAPPVAHAGPDQIVTASEVRFDGSASADPDGSIARFDWAFGDGASGQGPRPVHVYREPGAYDVRLTVTDDSGTVRSSSSDSLRVLVNQAPIADAGPDQLGAPGQELTFSGSASLDPDGDIARYLWDFKDGSTASGERVTHKFAQPGTYQVRLTVQDDTGQPDAIDFDEAAVVVNAPPVAKAGPDLLAAPGDPVVLDASNSFDRDGAIATYRWDFSDRDEPATDRVVTRSYAAPGVYSARLTVTDDSGAINGVAQDEVAIRINHAPVANAGRDVFTSSNTLSFDGSAAADADGDALIYSWDFGDGTPPAGGARVTHTYVDGGTYPVVLTVDDGTGLRNARANVAVTVKIDRPPVADAGGNREACGGDVIVFDGSRSRDPEGGLLRYHWDFGDGTTSDIVNPTKTYTRGAVYPVTLTVEDDSGFPGNRHTDRILVKVNESPIAVAGPDQLACAGAEVHFDGSASRDSDGVVNRFTWNFGDGATGGGVAPVHVFGKPADYRVVLTIEGDVIGQCANTNSSETTVKVVEAPSARIAAPPSIGVGAPAGFDATGSSTVSGRIVGWSWDFGDGATAEGAKVEHVYQEPGTRIATLTLRTEGGIDACSTVKAQHSIIVNAPPVADAGPDRTVGIDEEILFDASASHDDDGGIVAYAWDFADGSTATGINARHSFRASGHYPVTLTVTDNMGLPNSSVATTAMVDVNQPPEPAIAAPAAACPGEQLTFSGGGSTDADGKIAAFAWKFGDGATADGAEVSHTYAAPGLYDLTLAVDDGSGLQNARRQTAIPFRVNRQPRAEAGPDRAACPGQEITFDAAASVDWDGNMTGFRWEFGDGISAEGAQVTHRYAEPGTYEARLTVTDDSQSRCAVASDVARILVNAPPVAQAGGDRSGFVGGAHDQLLFDGSGSTDADGHPLSYVWDLGDGVVLAGDKVRHGYARAGTYPVRLTVSDGSGLACGQASQEIEVSVTNRQ